MRKTFLENWRNALNINGKISRLDFCFFSIVNYFIFIIIGVTINSFIEFSDSKDSILNSITIFLFILFLVPICTAAIRRLNDINKSKSYLLFPFYNIFLLLHKGTQQNILKIERTFQVKLVLRIFLGIILIGITNLIFSLLYISILDNNASTNTLFGITYLSLLTLPLAFLLTFLLLLFKKENISTKIINMALIRSFLIIFPVFLIIIYEATI